VSAKLQVRGISTEKRKEKRVESGIENKGREGKTPLHFVTHCFLFLCLETPLMLNSFN
jgi:hypothetical protein